MQKTILNIVILARNITQKPESTNSLLKRKSGVRSQMRRRRRRAQPGVERSATPGSIPHATELCKSSRGGTTGLDAVVNAYSLRRTTAAPSTPPTRQAGVFHGRPYRVAPYE